MTTATTATITVPGGRLYHEVRGSGPLLIIVPTGNGDATPFGPLADALAGSFTVVTYDRRGYSRSTVTTPVADGDRLAADVADVAALAGTLGDGTARIFGSSAGAIVALATLEQRPDVVVTAVVHEAPLASVLPDAAHWLAAFDALHDVFLREGVGAAMARFRVLMGMTAPARPPREAALPPVELAEMLERVRRNHAYWFAHELRTYPAHRPDLVALAPVADRLVLAGGSGSRDAFPYRPGLVLAAGLGRAVVDLPGGHVGHVTHPCEFASRLAALLGGS